MENMIVLFGDIVLRLFDGYRILLIVYFFLSWLPGAYGSTLGQILYSVCEPYVGFFRRFVPPIGMISFAGLVSILALSLIRSGFVAVLRFLLSVV